MTSTDMIIGALPHKSQAERARMRANAARLLDKGTQQQKADARKLLDALASLDQAEAQTLYDRLSGMTVAKRVVEAFRAQGRPANGRIEWHVKGSAMTYHDWEAAKLLAANVGEDAQ